ncbi:hypothetical protein PHISCL_02980 [Aspergillus sclerotialis]|uniref:Uncharacterized protein n=1 Tax=Aspergillus sclerotialis TaxID=2070753 RepID=A0A3A3A3Q4_9EURO|nr:hypothetical protein PHISCL_02980 [Aspergillus sclerotialis]
MEVTVNLHLLWVLRAGLKLPSRCTGYVAGTETVNNHDIPELDNLDFHENED